jgi:putative transposase
LTGRFLIRGACATLRVDTSLYHCKSKRGEQAELKTRIEEIAQTRVLFGYGRVHVLLRHEGWLMNPKRICRLYKELGLQLHNKTPKRRVKAKLMEDSSNATHSNQVWAMDFVHDQLATGRKIRVFTVVDSLTRYCPALDPRFSYRSEDVVVTLDQACREVGYPKTIRVDQGSEFISRDLDLWAYQKGVELTSQDQESRPTTHLSKASTANSAASV